MKLADVITPLLKNRQVCQPVSKNVVARVVSVRNDNKYSPFSIMSDIQFLLRSRHAQIPLQRLISSYLGSKYC
jgi:hypothetical protein